MNKSLKSIACVAIIAATTQACDRLIGDETPLESRYELAANVNNIKELSSFFELHYGDTNVVIGQVAGTKVPCRLTKKHVKEEVGQGVSAEISLNADAVDQRAGNSEANFRVWSFKPSERAWSFKRKIGTVVKDQVAISQNGGQLSASVVSSDFRKNIILAQRETVETLTAKKLPNGGMEISIENVMPDLLALVKPKVVTCRFDSLEAH